jgi:hypothetical protein
VPEEQRYFLLYEEFFAAPSTHYAQVLAFLGLPCDGRTEFPVINPAATARHKALQRLFRQPPFPINRLRGPLRAASRALRLQLGARAMSLAGSQPQAKEELRPEFERELYEFFAPDVSALEGLLGRRLDIWRPCVS